MIERERLAELLETAIRYADTNYGSKLEHGKYCRLMADHLLSNGVIVPPCKVGDTVYTHVYDKIEGFVVMSIELSYTTNGFEGEFVASNGKYPMLFSFENIGETVFLSREEAENTSKVWSERE